MAGLRSSSLLSLLRLSLQRLIISAQTFPLTRSREIELGQVLLHLLLLSLSLTMYLIKQLSLRLLRRAGSTLIHQKWRLRLLFLRRRKWSCQETLSGRSCLRWVYCDCVSALRSSQSQMLAWATFIASAVCSLPWAGMSAWAFVFFDCSESTWDSVWLSWEAWSFCTAGYPLRSLVWQTLRLDGS